jgi:hypothetical protein
MPFRHGSSGSGCDKPFYNIIDVDSNRFYNAGCFSESLGRKALQLKSFNKDTQ